MKWDWNELFGEGFLVDFAEGQRKYFALDEISTDDVSVFFSKTNLWYKRTTVFWNNMEIIKVIVEENRVLSDGTVNLRTYLEYDTKITTENREMILPLTAKGKSKKVNATNILAVTPFGCSFSMRMDKGATRISVVNPRSCQRLAIGEDKRIRNIKTKEDFTNFLSCYIDSCPCDYMERVDKVRNSKKVTIKYKVGDIFRLELDRFSYCYGMITGEIGKMRKALPLPERHSLHAYMMVPLAIRFFDLITDRADMTVDELLKYPLGGVEICGDNDLIWGVYPVIGRKKPEIYDIDFNLICTKFISKDPHINIFSQNLLMGQGSFKKPEKYDLHIEWGTAYTELKSERLTDKLKAFFDDYCSPFSGVAMSVYPNYLTFDENARKALPMMKYDLRNEANTEIRRELFALIGLEPDAGFDDFARKFGGLTKAEIFEKLK